MRVPRYAALINRFLKAGALAAWVIGLCWLLGGQAGVGRLTRFLRPEFWYLVAAGAVILFVFLLITLASKNFPRPSGVGMLMVVLDVSILMVPLLYLPLAYHSRLGVTAFQKRSVSGGALFRPVSPAVETDVVGKADVTPQASGPVLDRDEPAADAASVEPEAEETVFEVSFRELSERAEFYEGKLVQVFGMVHRPLLFPEDTFFCFRFLVTCCVADAQPTGVAVRYRGAADLEEETWIRVRGRFGSVELEGYQRPLVVADQVESTDEPDEPYVYW